MPRPRVADLLRRLPGFDRPWNQSRSKTSPNTLRWGILLGSVLLTIATWTTLFRQYSLHLSKEFREDLETVALHALQRWTVVSLAVDLQIGSAGDDQVRPFQPWAEGLLQDPRVAPTGIAILEPDGTWRRYGNPPSKPELTAFAAKGPLLRQPVPFPDLPNQVVLVYPLRTGSRLFMFLDVLPTEPGLHPLEAFDLVLRDASGQKVAVRENPDHPADRFHLLTGTRTFTWSNQKYVLTGYANPRWFSAVEFTLILGLLVANLLAIWALHRILQTVFRQRDLSLSMLDRLTGGTLLWQVPGTGYDFSPRLRGLLGLRSSIPLPPLWQEHVHTDDRARIEEALDSILRQTTQERELEVRLLSATGESIWCRLHLSRMPRGDGREPWIWGAVVDLRESHRQQEELAASRERFRSIYEESREAILVLDHGGFLHGNRRALELFGFSTVHQLIGEPFSRITPDLQPNGDPSQSRLKRLIEETLHGGSAETEILLKSAEGQTFMGELTLAAFLWDGRKVLQAVVRDIRDRHMLEETNRRLKAALDASALISVVDLDGKLLEVNDEFCRVHGYARQELAGHNYRVLASGMHPPAFWSALRTLLLSGQSWRGDVVNRRKDGTLVHLQTTIQPMPQPDGSVRFLTVRFDVTARVQQEERLKQDLSRRNRDLHLAWHIQTGLNTREIPPVPFLSAAAHIQPSETIGGDFLRLHGANGCLFVVLADCTGHGIGAAMEATLLAAMVDVAMEVLLEHGPEAFLKDLNRRIMPYMPESHYPTVLAACIHPVEKKLVWAQGGAEPPFLHGPRGTRLLPRPPGLNLGLDPEADFVEQVVPLEIGDRLVFYSDAWLEYDPLGVPRSQRLARLTSTLSGLPKPTLEALQHLEEEFARALGGTPLKDDLTLCVVDFASEAAPKSVPVHIHPLGDLR